MSDEYLGDDEQETGTESGGSLRAKLESEIAANKELKSELAVFKARAVISEKGFDLVEPEELKGVSPDEVETKAEELQAQRLELAQRVLGKTLGIEDPDLDLNEALKQLAGKASGSEGESALGRARQLNQVTGEPVGSRNPYEGLSGPERIRAAFGSST